MKKILTIGNSFAGNAVRFLPQLAQAGGADLYIGCLNPGGCSLEKHWNLHQQAELLPDVKPYLYRVAGTEENRPAALKEILAGEAWDYVTLQQVSTDSWQKATFSPYIDKLHGLVRECAPQAVPVIHQTWAYRSDAWFFNDHPVDQSKMYALLKEAYNEAAARLGCRQLPCGDAFRLAREKMGYTPDTAYDFTDPQPLDLPDQTGSLITGYFWATGNTPSGKAELRQDYRHGNDLGCYLAGAVWYEMFSGNNVLENPFCPEGVSLADLTVLKDAAHAAVGACGGAL